MWDKPSICELILEFLRARADIPVREHDLIHYLAGRNCFASLPDDSANLTLFRKHFITRHCLYSLQRNLDASCRLRMDAMEICLVTGCDETDTQLGFSAVDLRDYYLDLAHLERSDDRSVSDLLASFWTRFASADAASEALLVLGVAASATWVEVQSAYRRKAQRAHPDQGGSAEAFAEVQNAFEVLRKHFNRQR